MKKIYLLGILTLAVILTAGCDYKIAKKDTGIGAEAAKAKVEKLIADSGGTATVKEVTEDGDLYKITVSANGQDQPVYITKDGTKLIQQAVSFEDIEKQKAEAKKQEEDLNKEIPKTDKPVVDLYVMSFCPYGNKAEDTLKSVYNLLKSKVDFNFRYIVNAEGGKITSLHGQPEVDQNEREACVLKNYGKDRWLDFVTYINKNCGTVQLAGACWEAGAKSLGINTAKISACVASEGTALMTADAAASNMADAGGSPTMIINGIKTKTVSQYGNSEAYKKTICGAFNAAPEECSKVLGTETTTSEGGSCGS